jgi:hypothetical protein
MVVGIVQAKHDAGAIASGLEADGHTVRILDPQGDIDIDFPRDLDVLVMFLGTSLGALERGRLIRAWAKAHLVPIVAGNDLSRIRMALEGRRQV